MEKVESGARSVSTTLYLAGSFHMLLDIPDQVGHAHWLHLGFLGGLVLLSGWIGVQRLREARPPALIVAAIVLTALSSAAATHLLIFGALWP